MEKKKLPKTVSVHTEIPSNWTAIEYRLRRELTEEEKSAIVGSYNEKQNGAYDWDVIDWDWDKG